jgi:hypothetical protein
MTISTLKRGALALGGAVLLLSATLGSTQAQTVTPTPTTQHAHSKGHHFIRHELKVAAKTLGFANVKALRQELAGSTLTTVAENHNVEPGVVAAAMKADVGARIQARVDAGKLDAAQAARLKVKAEARIDGLMTHQFRAP